MDRRPLRWTKALALATIVSLGAVAVAADDEEPAGYEPPTGAAVSISRMSAAEGFRVELVASEPLVVDPVSICFAGDGSLWVVEMGDYPLGGRGGRVKRLRDMDGDGVYDRATIFLDELKHPTSVLPWRDGLFVAAAPQIIWARDTDGDGRADEQRVVLRGFGLSNAQHQVNSLSWGLDNRIHAANGDSGGVVEPRRGEAVDIHGHDLAFDPRSGELVLQAGMSQHTRFRDDWGRWFGGNSAWPLWQDLMPVRYLNRNPLAGATESCRYLTEPAANPIVYPRSRQQPRLNELAQARRITSACGGAYYRDDRFGENYLASVFVCDPANNLVHHRTLKPAGAGYEARRPDDQLRSEFLASRDTWFRPVHAATGTDGALYVVDMYRLIIEHPDYFERDPASLERIARGSQKNVSDELMRLLRQGADRGRIYRLTPNRNGLRSKNALPSNAGEGLIAWLESRNGVRRDIAHQRVVAGSRVDLAPKLVQLARQSDAPRARVQALAALSGLGRLRSDLVLNALRDEHAEVRRFAIQLADDRLNETAVLEEVVRRTEDADAAVMLQATLTLGGAASESAGEHLGRIAVRHLTNPDMLAAVVSARPQHIGATLRRVIAEAGGRDDALPLISQLLQSAVRNDDIDVLSSGLNALAEKHDAHHLWRLRIVGRLLESLDHAAIAWTEWAGDDEKLAAAMGKLDFVFEGARRAASDGEVDPTLRVASIRLLGRGDVPIAGDIRRLIQLIRPTEPLDVQLAAVRTLSAIDQADVADALLSEWRQRGPAVRREIVKTLLNRRAWTLTLLRAIETERVADSELTLAQREQLRVHYYRDVRREAKRVLADASAENSLSADAYAQEALTVEGDVARGVVLFVKHCASCHRDPPVRSAGPPLSSLTQLTRARIVDSVLAPSRVVEPAYATYGVVAKNGRLYSGVIRNESAASIEIIDADGRSTRLLRKDIAQLQAQVKSLMPEQLRRILAAPKDLADIAAAMRSRDGAAGIRRALEAAR